jgi:Na+-driven multidrug efflux pump
LHADTGDSGAVVAAPTPSHIPGAKALLLFALPTLVLPLADPVMSLIDTVCIGSYGTVVELAATGPASLLFASASQLFSAFSATALADISRALSKGDRAEASEHSQGL